MGLFRPLFHRACGSRLRPPPLGWGGSRGVGVPQTGLEPTSGRSSGYSQKQGHRDWLLIKGNRKRKALSVGKWVLVREDSRGW